MEKRNAFCNLLIMELINASIKGDFERVLTLLNNEDIDINFQDEKHKKTSLMYAAIHGNFNVLEILLDNGANVNIRDALDRTALILGSNSKDSLITVGILLKHGACINSQDIWGWTALMYAAIVGNFETSILLLSSGSDTTIQNRSGRTFLNCVKYKDRAKIEQFLNSLLGNNIKG